MFPDDVKFGTIAPMKKSTLVGLILIAVILIALSYLYYSKFLGFEVSWTPQSFKVESVHPIYAHWADWLKFCAAFLATVWLWWATASKNTIGLLKTPLFLLSCGVMLSAFSYFSGCFTRSILGYEAGTMSPETFLGAAAIPFIVASFVLLLFRIKVKLGLSKEILFWTITTIAAILMFVFAIIPTIANVSEDLLIKTVKAVIDFGVLVAFVGAFRAMLVFSGGKLGYDWLLVSVGAMLLNLYFFYVMTPGIPNITVFHWINTLWVGGYLFTALGGFQLAFPDLA